MKSIVHQNESEIINLYNQGYTLTNLGKMFKVDSQRTIKKLLIKNNVQLRLTCKEISDNKPSKEELKELIDQGFGSVEISKIYNVNPVTIRSWVINYNLPKFTNEKLVDKEAEIIQLYNAGLPSGKIAIKFHTTAGTIIRYLRKNNVKIRDILINLPVWNEGLTSKTNKKFRDAMHKAGNSRRGMVTWQTGKKCPQLSECVKKFHREHPEFRKQVSKRQKEYYQTHDGTFKGRHHTEKTKRILSLQRRNNPKVNEHLKRIRKLAAKHVSNIERKIRRELVNRGYIDFLVNHTVYDHNIDLIFPKEKLAIECEGCYFHGCKLCYPNIKITESLIYKKNRDKKKEIVLNENNWKLLRIWEHEINNDVQSCVQNIINELKIRQ